MELAKIFCDNAVFQAGKKIRVFGTGDGEGTITFDGKTYNVKSENGFFETFIDEHKYGGPYTLEAILNGKKTVINDVMVGEVLFVAGQSNMQWCLRETENMPNIRRGKKNDMLRLYLTKRLEENPNVDSDMGWVKCDEDNILSWTSLGYYYAEMLNEKFGCAVGVLCCYQGASIIQTWLPRANTLKDGLRVIHERDLIENMEKLYYNWNLPGTCYEYQFKPICPYTVSKIYWYQGCSNTNDASADIYGNLLVDLAKQWRKDLKDESLEFVVYVLHDFVHPELKVITDNWKKVQKAQREAPKYVDNCVVIETADISEHNTIHPTDKYPLAVRTFETFYGKYTK